MTIKVHKKIMQIFCSIRDRSKIDNEVKKALTKGSIYRELPESSFASEYSIRTGVIRAKNHVSLCIAIIFCAVLNAYSVLALEFEKEADKTQWIKEFFKNKKFEPIGYAMDATKEEKQFDRQMLKDFINQNGIEHVEPIAVGKSIYDPEIAKFNIACPDKKPINIYRQWDPAGSRIAYEASEETLEDPNNEYSDVIIQRSCTGNLKVYRYNVFNTANNKQEYVLYCDYFKTDRYAGKNADELGLGIDESIKKEDFYIEGAYLYFDPEQCVYSKKLPRQIYPTMQDYVSGIFKYNNKYYFYEIRTFEKKSGKKRTNIGIWRKDGFDNSKFYFYETKEVVK